MQSLLKSSSEFINAYQFLSVCLHVINETGKIILELSQNKSKQQVKHKGIDDPVTQADLAGQELIIRALHHFWPKLNIIGEESQLPEKQIDYDVTKINVSLLSQDLFKNSNQQQQQPIIELPISDCLVWIDPLDGTLSYTKNELDAVTTLVGLTFKGNPLLGLVGQHFILQKKADVEYDYFNYQYKYQPVTFFSHAQSKEIYTGKFDIDQNNQFILDQFKSNIPEQVDLNKRFIIATSKNHSYKEMEDEIKQLNPTSILQFGGCGRKILSVIRGECDLYLFNSQYTMRWDIAAGDALMHSVGGVLAGTNGQQYKYIGNQSLSNDNGIMVSSSQELHEIVLKKLKQQKNSNL